MKEQSTLQPFCSRPYQGSRDFAAILDLVKARPMERARDYPSSADLQELLEMPKIKATTRVWETLTGRPVGYALLNHAETFANLAFEYLTQFSNSAIGEEMIAWGEKMYLECCIGNVEELTSSTHDGQVERIALLERHGFKRCPESVVEMFRSLDEPISVPNLPEGFTIRQLNGEAEVAAWVALHRAAFGTQNMSEEYRLTMMRVTDYDPALDLVLTAPDGTLVSYVFGAIHTDENEQSGMEIGYPDIVGTLPQFRGHGFATALLLECIQRIKERGMKTACLHTSSENIAIQRAATAAGFCITGQAYHYTKICGPKQPG